MAIILVVDDDLLTLDLAAQVLHAAGFQVKAAASARAALAMLAAEPIDLVLLEILLPEKEGLETIIEISRRWPALPVLAMSGGGALVSWREALPLAKALGARAALTKPLSPHELIGQVRAALGVGVDG